MPHVFRLLRMSPGYHLVGRAVLLAALTTTGAASSSCTHSQRPIYRAAPPPVAQAGEAHASASPREPDEVQYLRRRRLIVPVAGVHADELRNDFHAARGGGRRHNAIDILAPFGTPVISADDGYIVRLTRNNAGGIVIYATDPEERVVYYYAHLAGYHDGIAAGKAIAKGDTIGYVGTSGNAPEDTPHLHFQITRMRPGGRYWSGEPLNPYPLLKGVEQRRGDPIASQTVAPQAQPRRDPAQPR